MMRHLAFKNLFKIFIADFFYRSVVCAGTVDFFCIGVSLSGASLFGEMKTVAAFAVLAYLAAMAYDVSKKFPKA